ncbi:MAG: hypothetical protein P8R42_22545 [Candidatus Binatia bacterium]|nr:hypothetical protein [Candidatus Binatia bacterium]
MSYPFGETFGNPPPSAGALPMKNSFCARTKSINDGERSSYHLAMAEEWPGVGVRASLGRPRFEATEAPAF